MTNDRDSLREAALGLIKVRDTIDEPNFMTRCSNAWLALERALALDPTQQEKEAKRYRWLRVTDPLALKAIAYRVAEACKDEYHGSIDATIDAAIAGSSRGFIPLAPTLHEDPKFRTVKP